MARIPEFGGAAPAKASSQPAAAWRGEIVAMLSLSAPLVFTSLATIAITTTDIIMTGWLGPRFLAAGSLGHNLYFPLYLFGLGICSAVAPIAAQARGARQIKSVRRTLRQGLWVSLAIGVPFSFVIWQGRPILLFFGQAEETAMLAEGYLRAAVWGLVPAFGIVALRSFINAHERARAPLVVTLIGVAVNALANYALMFGHFGFPRLELVGAGISTAIVNVLMFASLLAFTTLDRRLRRYAILIRFWRPDWQLFREILRIGLPIGLTILAESGFFSAAALLMGLLGTEFLAAHAIAVQSVSVAFMVPLGISVAATVRVGLAVGRRDPGAAARAGWAALAIGVIFMLAASAIFWFGGRQIIGLYLDLEAPENAAAIALGVSFLVVGAIFQLADGVQIILGGALRGMKDTRVPLAIAVFGYWGIGFSGSVLLGFHFEFAGVGIWSGLAFGISAVALLLFWRFRAQLRGIGAGG